MSDAFFRHYTDKNVTLNGTTHLNLGMQWNDLTHTCIYVSGQVNWVWMLVLNNFLEPGLYRDTFFFGILSCTRVFAQW